MVTMKIITSGGGILGLDVERAFAEATLRTFKEYILIENPTGQEIIEVEVSGTSKHIVLKANTVAGIYIS